jgi:hypothetical protein
MRKRDNKRPSDPQGNNNPLIAQSLAESVSVFSGTFRSKPLKSSGGT